MMFTKKNNIEEIRFNLGKWRKLDAIRVLNRVNLGWFKNYNKKNRKQKFRIDIKKIKNNYHLVAMTFDWWNNAKLPYLFD